MREQAKYHHWTTASIASAIGQFILNKERLPVAREMNPRNGLPTCRTFEKIMGTTWGNYAKLHYPKLVELGDMRHRQRVLDIRREQSEWTKEKLILAIEHFVEENGRLPLIQEYTTENGLPSYTTFCKISEQVMSNYLEKRFSELIDQNRALQENEAEDLDQESSPDMEQRLC